MHSGIAAKKDETTWPKVTVFPHLERFNLLQVEFMTSFSEQHLSLQVRALNPPCSLAQNASTSRDRPVIFGSVHLNTNSPARLPDSCDTYPSPLYELSVSIVPLCKTLGQGSHQDKSHSSPPPFSFLPFSKLCWLCLICFFLSSLAILVWFFRTRGSGE